MLLAFSLIACGYRSDEEKQAEKLVEYDLPAGVTPPIFDIASVIIDSDEGSVLLETEVAETDAQRAFGLMFRKTLEPDSGMLFIYFEETKVGLYMKDTLVPLSAAFFDIDGKIVDIIDMDPCESDTCEIYVPAKPYMGALEVNQGAFDEWGVEVGDEIQITR